MKTETVKKSTDCGAHFEHDTHVYRTERGKAKACDGTFREDKS